jgi:hypothetical protein
MPRNVQFHIIISVAELSGLDARFVRGDWCVMVMIMVCCSFFFFGEGNWKILNADLN